MHEGYEPDSIADFLDPDVLTGEGLAEVDLALAEANAPAVSDGHGSIVEGILEDAQAAIRSR